MSQTLNSLRFRITKRFGAKTVLDDFALEVRGRQFVTLLGPSGCGKSTALNIVAGLIPASEGELWIDGARMDQLPAEQRGFGMVFQNYALFPHMTVFGNIAFGLEIQRRPAAELEQRVRAMLALVQLPELGDRYPSQLSGGRSSMRSPSSQTSPALAGIRPATMFSAVDLPQPLGPSSVTNCRPRTSSAKSCSTVFAPKRLVSRNRSDPSGCRLTAS